MESIALIYPLVKTGLSTGLFLVLVDRVSDIQVFIIYGLKYRNFQTIL